MTAPAPLGRDGFAREAAALGLDVSRETLDRLETHLTLLAKWQPKINLVGPSTLADPWRRHVLDSAQLVPLLPDGCDTVVDMGSGAGFPGIVLAILGGVAVTSVESDQRKGIFQREVVRVTGAPVRVATVRMESVEGIRADAVTARALAPLDRLIAYAAEFLGPGGICLFPKGKDADKELTESVSDRIVSLNRFPSRSDPAATILRFALAGP